MLLTKGTIMLTHWYRRFKRVSRRAGKRDKRNGITTVCSQPLGHLTLLCLMLCIIWWKGRLLFKQGNEIPPKNKEEVLDTGSSVHKGTIMCCVASYCGCLLSMSNFTSPIFSRLKFFYSVRVIGWFDTGTDARWKQRLLTETTNYSSDMPEPGIPVFW